MTPLPQLTLLSLLLVAAGGFTFVPHVVEHARTPLKTAGGFSITQCAVWCRQTSGCIKWSRDPETILCQLWPLHSADNPLTEVKEPLYQTILPEGFVLSDDPTIAYRQRAFSLVGGKESIIASCKAYDPEAFPAFPNTEQQVNYIKANTAGTYFYVGIYRDAETGVFTDMTTGSAVELLDAWFWDGAVDTSADDCTTAYSAGLWTVPCTDTHGGHICQYNLTAN